MKRVVGQALAGLDSRERFIAERRLMADGKEALPLADIGRQFGVSRERARQLETRAKRKLRGRITATAVPAIADWLGAPPEAD